MDVQKILNDYAIIAKELGNDSACRYGFLLGRRSDGSPGIASALDLPATLGMWCHMLIASCHHATSPEIR